MNREVTFKATIQYDGNYCGDRQGSCVGDKQALCGVDGLVVGWCVYYESPLSIDDSCQKNRLRCYACKKATGDL